MASIALFIFFFVALLIGWLLGKYGRPNFFTFWRKPKAAKYLKGIIYLVNEQSDEAVESFLSQLKVTSKTLHFHISMGAMFRRKGELDKAIRVHQHLIESHALDVDEVALAQLELARDFYSSGIHDRVEMILKDLVNSSSFLKGEALDLLLSVYRDERSWQLALDTAQALSKYRLNQKTTFAASEYRRLVVAMAHFCCELAEEYIGEGDFKKANESIGKSIALDDKCVRASLLKAELAIRQHQNTKAQAILLSVIDQNIELFSEAVEVLADLPFDKAVLQKVEVAQAKAPSSSGLNYVIKASAQIYGEQCVHQKVVAELERKPSISGLSMFYDSLPEQGKNGEEHRFVKQIVQQLVSRRARYICNHCGFRGNQMHWLCPSCKQWGEIRQRYGL